MSIAEVIGINLRKEIKAKKTNVTELSDRTNVSRSTIHRIIRGAVMPQQAVVSELCFELNINETDLIKLDF